MSLPHHNEISCWYDDLSQACPHYTPVKCYSILQFYKLRGKTTIMSVDNLEPIHNLTYAYHAPQENKYYLKHFRDYKYQDLLVNEDEAMNVLRRRVDANLVHLMFTLQNISDMSDMLKKLFRAQFKQEGKLDYRIYLQLLGISIKQEDYKDMGKNLTGYRTVLNMFDRQLADLWGKAKITQK